MTDFSFQPANFGTPWLGPYSPRRGNHTGLTVRAGHLGAFVATANGFSFWPARPTLGVASLVVHVATHHGGGRVVLLPSGWIVKPLADEAGHRVVLGRYTGHLQLMRPDGTVFDLGSPGTLRPGDRWPGPASGGLECVIAKDGVLRSITSHPNDCGAIQVTEPLTPPNADLAAAFRTVRLAYTGRVHITAHGHVLTRLYEYDTDDWNCLYVGHSPPSHWMNWDRFLVPQMEES